MINRIKCFRPFANPRTTFISIKEHILRKICYPSALFALSLAHIFFPGQFFPRRDDSPPYACRRCRRRFVSTFGWEIYFPSSRQLLLKRRSSSALIRLGSEGEPAWGKSPPFDSMSPGKRMQIVADIFQKKVSAIGLRLL